jgi:hypothetical protein
VSRIQTLHCAGWSDAVGSDVASTATAALEGGNVLFLPHLRFGVERQEDEIFSPAILSSSKNTSFDPVSGKVGGTALTGGALDRLRGVMTRFSQQTSVLAIQLLPGYGGRLQQARASFRPAEVAGRQTSWRKDDTRLHIDSFPASPVQGRRILRVFSNVNPNHRPRSWRVGGEFEDVARRFAASLTVPPAAHARLLQALGMTRSRRSPYDGLMLQLHDRMKEDLTFQKDCEQEAFDFSSGTTWMAFTDQVSHAATAGQYQLEQTFLLPVDAMIDERRSPLRILERLKGRPLV